MICKSIGCTLYVWLKGFFWTFCPYYQLLCVSCIIWYLVAISETKDVTYPFGYNIMSIDLSKINKMTLCRAVECTQHRVGKFMKHVMLSHQLNYTFLSLTKHIQDVSMQFKTISSYTLILLDIIILYLNHLIYWYELIK